MDNPLFYQGSKSSPFINSRSHRDNVSIVHLPQNAFSALRWQQQQKRSRISKRVDKIIQGVPSNKENIFILNNGITELSGEAGTGKTQICLDYCASLALRRKKSLYIAMGSSNFTWRTLRLERILKERMSSHTQEFMENHVFDTKHLMENIIFKSVTNIDHFRGLLGFETVYRKIYHRDRPSFQNKKRELEDLLTSMCDRGDPVEVIIIDSIGALFRTPDDVHKPNSTNSYSGPNSNMELGFVHARAKILFQASGVLKRLSDQYDVPILVVNEVTSLDPKTNSSLLNESYSTPNRPSLGLAWSCCINHRYRLTRQEEACTVYTQSSSEESYKRFTIKDSPIKFKRQIYLDFSPRIRADPHEPIAHFKIDSSGVHWKQIT